MLLGDARISDERVMHIEITEHRVLYGERIHDESTANRIGAWMEAFRSGQIRESEECPLIPLIDMPLFCLPENEFYPPQRGGDNEIRSPPFSMDSRFPLLPSMKIKLTSYSGMPRSFINSLMHMPDVIE